MCGAGDYCFCGFWGFTPIDLQIALSLAWASSLHMRYREWQYFPQFAPSGFSSFHCLKMKVVMTCHLKLAFVSPGKAGLGYDTQTVVFALAGLALIYI